MPNNDPEFEIVVTPRGAPLILPEVPTFELRQIMWNDGGFMTTYDVTFRQPRSSPIPIGHVKIMRRELKQDEFALKPGAVHVLRSDFCAVGQSYTFYEELASLGQGIGKAFLRRIKDVAVSPSRLKRFKDDPVFQKSLLREGRATRALEDAPRLFDISGASKASRLPRKMSLSVRLGNNDVSFPVDFRELSAGVPSRILALVGDNGTGKSAMLGLLAATVIHRNNMERPESSVDYGFFATRRGNARERVDFSRVVTISYGAFDEHALPDDLNPKIERNDETPTVSATNTGYFYRGLRDRDQDGRAALKNIGQVEDELWTALRTIRDPRRREAFRDAVLLLSGATNFPEDILEELLSTQPGRISLSHLSSGQTIVLNVLVSLIAYLEPGSLVLIDEPEVHLHPPLVSALIRGIASSLEEFESVAFLATHSSVVIQELPARNVRVLRRVDNVTTALQPELETYGESLGLIDRNVFGLAGVQSDFIKVIEALNPTASVEQAQADLGVPLSNHALALFLSSKRNQLAHS